jgi:hypothetical protein
MRADAMEGISSSMRMRAPSLNIARRTTVALAALAVATGTLAGCGGGQPDATVLLRDTFDAHKQIESGKVNVELTLSGTGSSTLSRPIELKVSGPFEEVGVGKLPRFSLAVDVAADGQKLEAGAISDSGRLYVELEGSAFLVPQSSSEALEKSFAKASRGSVGSSAFSALGIEPGRWLTHPLVKGEATIDGVKTTEIEGGLNLEALLKDSSRLSGEAGSTGLAGATGTLSPKLITELAKSVGSASVKVYTGNSDDLLRRLTLTASIAPKGAAATALGGLRTAKLRLDVGFEDIGAHQQISPPKEAKPLSELLEVLEGVGLVRQKS